MLLPKDLQAGRVCRTVLGPLSVLSCLEAAVKLMLPTFQVESLSGTSAVSNGTMQRRRHDFALDNQYRTMIAS